MAVILARGTSVRGYSVLEAISTGGEGTVYRARRESGDVVVLKQLNFSASDPSHKELRERALRLEALFGLHCPCVCEIHEVFIEADLVYVAMEFVPGRSLEQLLKEKGPFPLEGLLPILQDMLAGLGWLHGLDIVHRDVKPANIIVTGGKGGAHAKLVDLGILLVRHLPRVTCKGDFLATPEYMAPEMLTDGDVDGRADLFSLGVTLFELLTGSLPLCDPGWPICRTFVKELHDPVRPSVRDLDDTIPEPIDGFVQRLMAVRPDDRPSSAARAWEELQSAVADSGMVISSEAPHTPGRRAPPALSSWNLAIESGPLAGATIPVPREGLTLGRTAVNPGDTRISRFHVRALPARRGLVVRDLGSLNGLIYRKQRLRRVLLLPGDSILVGETELRFIE